MKKNFDIIDLSFALVIGFIFAMALSSTFNDNSLEQKLKELDEEHLLDCFNDEQCKIIGDEGKVLSNTQFLILGNIKKEIREKEELKQLCFTDKCEETFEKSIENLEWKYNFFEVQE